MTDAAINIIRRANAKGVSVARLCREAGVSRAWFENFKKRVPKSVEAFLKIDRFLRDEK